MRNFLALFFLLSMSYESHAAMASLITCGQNSNLPQEQAEALGIDVKPFELITRKLTANEVYQSKLNHIRDFVDYVFVSANLRTLSAENTYVGTERGATYVRNLITDFDPLNIFLDAANEISNNPDEKASIAEKFNSKEARFIKVLPTLGSSSIHFLFSDIYSCFEGGTGTMIRQRVQYWGDHDFDPTILKNEQTFRNCRCYRVRI